MRLLETDPWRLRLNNHDRHIFWGTIQLFNCTICFWSCVMVLSRTVRERERDHLRSEAKGLLDEPRTRLKFGDRAFSISAPRLWNALPQHLKDSTSCQAFKKCLKTHLFRLAHWGVVDYDSNYDNVQRFWTFYEWKRRYINSNYYYYYY